MLNIFRRSSPLLRTGTKTAYSFGQIQHFSSEELSKAEKYVEETLRSRTWVSYMLATYFPANLRPSFYAIHLFDMELTKISENAREPALGTFPLTQLLANLIFGKNPCSPSTTVKNLSHSLYRSVCTTQSTTTP